MKVKFSKAARALAEIKEGPGPGSYCHKSASMSQISAPRPVLGKQKRKIDVVWFNSKNVELIKRGIH